MCSSDTTGSRVSYELSFYSEAVVKCQCSFSCMRAPRVTRDCTTTESFKKKKNFKYESVEDLVFISIFFSYS